MSRFVLGDELGNIKLLHYNPDRPENKTDLKILCRQEIATKSSSVQRLAVKMDDQTHILMSAAFSDGNCTLSTLDENDVLTPLESWKETHINGSKFVGLSIFENSIFTCTSSGMLRQLVNHPDNDSRTPNHASLPSRLSDWRLSLDGKNFAYGGEEVDLSVWNVERTFQGSQQEASKGSGSKKRKNDEAFLPGEIWRARNLPNDQLGLRQPIRITTLAYLDPSSSGYQLVTGTQFGDIRRYDTRSGRRPVSNWTKLGKVGGVKVIEKGSSEHQIFMGDGGSSLYAVDMRTGRVLHGYKGISGAVTSIAPSPTVMVSTALDRFARIHSVVVPPHNARERQEHKAEILEKCYFNSTPTVVVWDQCIIKPLNRRSEDDEDDLWNNLENITDT